MSLGLFVFTDFVKYYLQIKPVPRFQHFMLKTLRVFLVLNL